MAKSFFVSCLSCAIVGMLCNTAFALRLCWVEISLNGEVILETSYGDNGHPDADAVWEGLKVQNLRETDAFKKLKIDPELKEYRFDVPPPQKGEEWPIKIRATYGGVAETRFVTIKRVAPDQTGGSWRIDAKDLDREFDTRKISRRQARELKDPKYDKIEAMIKEKAESNVKK